MIYFTNTYDEMECSSCKLGIRNMLLQCTVFEVFLAVKGHITQLGFYHHVV